MIKIVVMLLLYTLLMAIHDIMVEAQFIGIKLVL